MDKPNCRGNNHKGPQPPERSTLYFYTNPNRKDGFLSLCKTCYLSVYRERRQRYRIINRHITIEKQRKQDAIGATFIAWLRDLLPCQNCKNFYNKACMQFDHTELQHYSSTGKKTLISCRGSHTLLLQELTKTKPLCANCHALKTAQQRECQWKEAA